MVLNILRIGEAYLAAGCTARRLIASPVPSSRRGGTCCGGGLGRRLAGSLPGGCGPMDQPFYDALESRDPVERERGWMAALPRVIAAAKERAPAYRRLFAQLRPEEVTDRRALARLPLTR